MPTDAPYTLQDLADLAGVTPRTVRYYVAQGLLPSPDSAGPGTRYSEHHLARLRVIRRLQREHLPLAEIRARLTGLDDDEIVGLVMAVPPSPGPGTALDYIREVMAGPAPPAPMAARMVMTGPTSTPPTMTLGAITQLSGPEPTPTTARSQWDRIPLSPDIELHVRRPLSRQQNKQVDRLITIARQLLEEETP
ncbi:MAG: MerR family transcriptional regulator [Candidatus Limnocylindrales bacterium]